MRERDKEQLKCARRDEKVDVLSGTHADTVVDNNFKLKPFSRGVAGEHETNRRARGADLGSNGSRLLLRAVGPGMAVWCHNLHDSLLFASETPLPACKASIGAQFGDSCLLVALTSLGLRCQASEEEISRMTNYSTVNTDRSCVY